MTYFERLVVVVFAMCGFVLVIDWYAYNNKDRSDFWDAYFKAREKQLQFVLRIFGW